MWVCLNLGPQSNRLSLFIIIFALSNLQDNPDKSSKKASFAMETRGLKLVLQEIGKVCIFCCISDLLLGKGGPSTSGIYWLVSESWLMNHWLIQTLKKKNLWKMIFFGNLGIRTQSEPVLLFILGWPSFKRSDKNKTLPKKIRIWHDMTQYDK